MTIATASPGTEQDNQTCDESCPYYRVGLPVVIARVALLPKDVPVRELPEDLLKAVHPDHARIEPADMRYGLRLPRAGYLYKIDENLAEVEGFRITEQGHFFPLDQVVGGNAPLPCDDVVHQADASMVTIANASRARKPIWFALSGTEWTGKLRQAFLEDSELRAKHMTPFNAMQWLASQEASGAIRVQEMSRYLYEYSWDDVADVRRKLRWSQDVPRGGLSEGQLIEMRANAVAKGKAVVLALRDPGGMAADLAALMQYRAERFCDSQDANTRRQISVCQAIDDIEYVVKENAENALTEKLERQAREWEVPKWRGNHARPADPDRAARIRAQLTGERLNREVDDKWRKYVDRFDQQGQQDWKEQQSRRFQEFNDAYIAPLAQMHRAWMQSDCMRDWLNGNHDGEDAESGAGYAGAVSLCIGSSQDKGVCFDLYSEWLQGESDDNPLLRAFAYNQNSIRDEVREAITPGLTWETVPWDRLAEVFEQTLGQYGGGQGGVLATLIGLVIGPVEAVAGRAASSGTVYQSLAMLGAAKKQPFVMLAVSGRSSQFWAMLTAETLRLTGEPVSGPALRQAIYRRLRRLSARGVSLTGITRNQWLLMIDPDQVRAMPVHLKGAGQMQARAAWLAAHVNTPAQVQRLNLAAWKLRMRQDAGRTVRGVSTAGLGILGLMTQHLAMSSLHGQLMSSMQHQRADVRRRLEAQWIQISGAYAALVGKGVEAAGRVRLRMARALRLDRIAYYVGRVGRGLNVLGAVMMAGADLRQAYIEGGRGNKWRSAGYVFTGVTGILFAVAISLGATGIGLLIAGVLIAASMLLDYFKPNKIQLWLERAFEWGRSQEQRYVDERTEERELALALGQFD